MRSMFAVALLGVLGPFSLSAGGAEAYPRPDLLLEPANLADSQATKRAVVLDARSRKDYDLGHVPGAVWIDTDGWKKAFGDSKDAGDWGKRIGQVGIDSRSMVVIYDAKNSVDAARMWWILRYWGVADVRLLHGGWNAWSAAKLPTTAKAPSVSPAAFQAQANAPRLATKPQLLDVLKTRGWQLVDARSSGEFCGVDLHGNKRGGSIPGAKHLDWTTLIDKKTHRFKSPAEMRRLFAAAGIEIDRPTAAYCQSGGRASVMALALELMGAPATFATTTEAGTSGATPPTPR